MSSKPLPTPDILGDLLGRPPAPIKINMNTIRVDGGTQMRAGLDEPTVKEYYDTLYTQELVGEWPFPPVIVFHDGESYWLGDGFHRLEAVKRLLNGNRVHEIPADVRAGTRRDAILFAAQANANHGLRRSHADKHRAVETILRDDEWSQWSDREIARRCNVSADLVGAVRKKLAPPVTVGNDSEPAARTFVTKHGATATMQVGNIGKTQPSYAAVWVIERAVKSTIEQHVPRAEATQTHADELHQAARTPGCALMRDIEATLDARDTEFRRQDLVQAMHNVASQMEQDLRNKQPPTVEDGDVQTSSNNIPYVDSQAQPSAAVVAEPPVSMRDGYDGDEWYTPEEIIRTAAHVLGRIDCDPATCELAQSVVQAATYFTRIDDGLKQPWNGSIWLNPPYSAPQAWTDKLFLEMATGRCQQAIVLVNNATETAWFQRLLSESKLVCFPSRRLAFWRHDHKDVGARQGQALFYFGPKADAFYSAFSATGVVLRRLK